MAKTSYVPSGAKIKAIGLGSAGSNAIDHMVQEQIRGVEFIVMNTDAQALAISETRNRVQLGERITRSLGAGGDPVMGRKAAEDSIDEIRQAVSGADMVFIIAGMGGGTGTGSSPIVAQIAKESSALTIAIVTRPFNFEGSHRNENAERGIMELMDKCDTMIIIPNDRLLDMADQKTGTEGAFKLADQSISHCIKTIAEVVTEPGLINLDFIDIRTIMKDAGPAWMCIGHGSGQNRAKDAAREALSSPLLDVSVSGAKRVLLNITGGNSLTLFEVNDVAEIIRQAVDPDATIIFGVAIDPNIGDGVRVTLFVTRFVSKEAVAGSANWKREISKLLKGFESQEELGVPSFMRNKTSLPVSRFRSTHLHRIPYHSSRAINDILSKAYSIYNSNFTDEVKTVRIKELRDFTNANHPNNLFIVNLLNSFWMLSKDINNVKEFAESFIDYLGTVPETKKNQLLMKYYSFILTSISIKSASDLNMVLSSLRAIVGYDDNLFNNATIPFQTRKLNDVFEG